VAPGWDPEALLTPDALDFLAVELEMTLPAKDGMGPAITPPWMTPGERAKLGA
jgi:hypothetical protein